MRVLGYLLISLALLFGAVLTVESQTGTKWVNLSDTSKGDGLTSGVAAVGVYFRNAAGAMDLVRGSISGGIDTSVKALPANLGAVQAVQRGSVFNSHTVSAVNTAIVVTIPAATTQRVYLYSLSNVRCTGGGNASLVVTDGGVTVWATATGAIPADPLSYETVWPVGLAFAVNSASVITLSACGAGNSGVLDVQADQF